ncbi:MAG: GntR family transcriptional regulator [Xanthobacteraceae bacterium]|nr:GntR family transcriptional regulator [Xanthobacteraceae bacterium]
MKSKRMSVAVAPAARGRARRERSIRLAAKATKPASGTLQRRVYNALARGLMGGMFTPGEAVSLRTLAARVGTSAMPVREAVSRLIAEGALVMLPNRSVIIPRMSRERFIELSRARQRLEGMLAEIGCTNARKADIDALARINEDLRRAIAGADTPTAMIGNMEFHFAFYALARSQVVLPLIETLWRQAGPFVALSAKMPNVRWTQRHHARLLAALRAGKARAARQAIEDDIEETLQQLLKKGDFEDGRRS